MTVVTSCHGYEGVMSVLCTPLQVNCYHISLQSSHEDSCSLSIWTGHLLFQTNDDLESCSHGLGNKIWVSAYGFLRPHCVARWHRSCF